MKELIFLKGNSANLPENRSEGTFYHVQDTKTIYLDDMVLEDSEAIKQAIETIIVDNELVTAQALTDLKDAKADISALTNYALLSDVPTKVSDLENDENYFIATTDGDGSNFLSDDGTYKKISVNGYATEQWVTEQGFLTEHQDISHLATQEALDNIDAKYADKELVTAAALTDLNKNKADKTEILTYSITKINESLEENVLEAYALTNSNGDEVGDRINIYKDSALQSAVLDGQELVLTYILSDGSTSIIRADISKFLHEDEFGKGLEITDNIVNVKIADGSEVFLTLDENGIKLDGVQTAIDTVKEELLGDYSEIEEEYQLNTLASINQTILENEQAIAAALTDLEETKAEKSDVTASLESISSVVDLKQDKLTAGTNIEITDNVVSCTIDTELYITVSELPTEDIKTNKVYILLNSEDGEQNIHEEYMYINGAWEKVGENQDNFVSKEEFQELYDGVIEGEEVIAAALTDLNENKADRTEFSALEEAVLTKVDTSALTNYSLTSHTHNLSELTNDVNFITIDDVDLTPYALQENLTLLETKVSDNELVTAAALTDLNERLDDKQDTLYGGENISITNGEISCTLEVPTKTSDLTNDSGFLTAQDTTISSMQSTIETLQQTIATLQQEIIDIKAELNKTLIIE